MNIEIGHKTFNIVYIPSFGAATPGVFNKCIARKTLYLVRVLHLVYHMTLLLFNGLRHVINNVII